MKKLIEINADLLMVALHDLPATKVKAILDAVGIDRSDLTCDQAVKNPTLLPEQIAGDRCSDSR